MSEALDKYKGLAEHDDALMRVAEHTGEDNEDRRHELREQMVLLWDEMDEVETGAARAFDAGLRRSWPALLKYKRAHRILADVTRNATVRRANDVTPQARLDELVAHWTKERDEAYALLTDEERRSVSPPESTNVTQPEEE